MVKLLIIGSPNQAIPPVNGGAVENLIKMFYETNEQRMGLEIELISCFDEKLDVDVFNQTHKNTRLHMMKRCKDYSKVDNFIYYGFYKIFHKLWLRKSCFTHEVISYIKENKMTFDKILVENYLDAILPLAKAFPNVELYFHIHNDKLNRTIIGNKKIINACTKIVTVSDYIKKCVNEISDAGNKTVTLYNSIYVKKFGTKTLYDNRDEYREQYGINKADRLLLYSGRIAKTKGVLQLIEAFSKLNMPNLKLMIVGNSWYGKGIPNDDYMKKLKKAAATVKDRIIFTGYVDYEDIPQYYAMADTVIIPSIWQEPCSLTLFETMASKVPLITTKTGGTPEIVKNYAKVLDIGEKFVEMLSLTIQELVNDNMLCESMAGNAYEYVQFFNEERYYRDFRKILMGESQRDV